MSLSVSCPQCGAEVVFRSAALPARVCDQCRSLLVRTDRGVGVSGKIAAVPFDVSPIQIGTRGTIDEQAFEVIGRIRRGWSDGAWNEWVLMFGDGATAWLGDAMGQFMFLREAPLSKARAAGLLRVINGGDILPGSTAQIGGVVYTIVDARSARKISAEGEVPGSIAEDEIYSVDLRGPGGECANLQRDGEGSSFYLGRYVRLEELRPLGLRRFEGWKLPAYAG